jgi:hypothetical protein
MPLHLSRSPDFSDIFTFSKQTLDVKNIAQQLDSSMAKVNGQLANE